MQQAGQPASPRLMEVNHGLQDCLVLQDTFRFKIFPLEKHFIYANISKANLSHLFD